MLGAGRENEVGVHLVMPNAAYADRGSTLTLRQPPPASPVIQRTGGVESNGGENALVPNFYYAAELGKNARYGLGLTSPFGLTTRYDANWVGRYHAIKTELITVELNPTAAFKINDTLSLGAGITLMKAEAEISQAQYIGPGTDGRSTVQGDDTAFGFNFGALLGDENARIGLGYRSRTDLDIEGDLNIVPLGIKTGANADLILPATAYLSGFKRLGKNLALLATLRWTDWSEFEELRIEFDNGLPAAVTPQNWKDSNTYSIGLRYRPDHRWAFRFGYAKDESPIKNDEFRTPRIPDTDRDWLAFGVSYRASAKTRVDFAYAHLFTDDAPVHETIDLNAAMPGTIISDLNGTYEDTEIDIFALRIHFALGGCAPRCAR